MISFSQFKQLSPDLQSNYLITEGVNLDLKLTKRNIEVALFAVHDFYAEVYFQHKTSEILRITCFRSLKKLNPYLSQIDIDDITILLSWI